MVAETDTMGAASQLEAVAFVGQVLSPLFLEDPETGSAGASLDAMASLDVDQAAGEWPFVDDALARENLALMQGGLASGAEGRSDLAWEYRRLFVGPAKKVVPPWGSVYTDRECVVFGASTLALRQWMRENGIARMGGSGTPEDSIGLMLSLMAWLAENRPELLDDYLQNHLLTWAGHFLDEMAEGTEDPFYRGLAGLTRASLEGIQSERAIQVTYPRFYR